MKNIKLTIEYDGTHYHGWQVQPNAVTVQDVVTRAIHGLTGENSKLIGASRTDFGVHAYGQVANFVSSANIPPDRFSYALNRMLPEDIVIRQSEEVPMEFHSRFHAVQKTYRYLIYNDRFPSALLRHRAYHISHKLDIGAMQKAAEAFVGSHDFAAFMASGGSAKTTVRTMRNATVTRDQSLVVYEVTGDGFLYNMVRIMTGTLIEVGLGRFAPEEVATMIREKNRKKAGRTAPAQGLYLMEIQHKIE